MKNPTTYTELKKLVDRAELAEALLETKVLTLEEVASIVKHENIEDLTSKLSIEITQDPEIFAATLQLTNYKMCHSWVGDDIVEEEGWLILGDAEFGTSYSYRYYNNGSLSVKEEREIEGDFTLFQKQVVLIKREESDHYNGRCHDDLSYKLVIYCPSENTNYLDEKTQKLIEELAL